METLIIQKYPKFNADLEFDDIIKIELIFSGLYHDLFDEEHNYTKEILDFYKPYYTRYKAEKYWYNPGDDNTEDNGWDLSVLREYLFMDYVPNGVLDWIETYNDGELCNHCVLTKELLEELLKLCRNIGIDENVAKETFPSEYDRYDSLYFERIFKLKTVLPHIIQETNFDKYEVACHTF